MKSLVNEMVKGLTVKRGEIWFVDFSYVSSSNATTCVQSGCRPAIIMSNNIGNLHSPVVTVIPLTSNMSKMKLPVHVKIEKECGLPTDSVALVEQQQTVDKTKLINKMCTLDCHTVIKVEDAIMLQCGIKRKSTKIENNNQNINMEYLTDLLISINEIDKLQKQLQKPIKAKKILLSQFITHCKECGADYILVADEIKCTLERKSKQLLCVS
jgi:mRNA interferase MazF